MKLRGGVEAIASASDVRHSGLRNAISTPTLGSVWEYQLSLRTRRSW